MLVTLTQFNRVATDGNGNAVAIGHTRLGCEARSTVGAFAALGTDTRFVRIATDTAIQVNINGGTTDAQCELIPANTVEFFAAVRGAIYTIAAA
jgi:hypothetical protein